MSRSRAAPASSTARTSGDLEQRLVGAGDADRDRLGLVLDGVDGAGQLVDRPGEGGGEVLDQHGRRADLAVLELVGVERDGPGGVAEQVRDARTAVRRLEVAVVAAGRGARRRTRHGRADRASASRGQHVLAVAWRRLRARASMAARDLAQRAGPARRWPARPRSRTGARPSWPARRPATDASRARGGRRARRRTGPRPRWRSRSGPPCGPGRSPPPWPRRRRWTRRARRRTPGSAARRTGRCASCPRWRRRRSTCSRARRA